MSLEFKARNLIERAAYFKKVRSFFEERQVLEVDTPILCTHPNLDTHIELFKTERGRYLHTSPEFGMKRLLAILKHDLYQFSHVFREYELGKKHNPEFMMIEWYRINRSLDFLIQETLDLASLFVSIEPIRRISYPEFFYEKTGIDLFLAEQDTEILDTFLRNRDEAFPPDLNFSEKIDYLFSHYVEHEIKNVLILDGFPLWQQALAKTEIRNGRPLAKRFEIYVNGLEIANGYDELTDPLEQRARFEKTVQERRDRGLSPYTIDENLLFALDQIPPCVGVAVGFDRLMMLALNTDSIDEVIPFSFREI